jgi:hypothetical protein
LAFSSAPLEAAYIQTISFGFTHSSYSWQIGEFNLQYKPGFNMIHGGNASIDWMTMTVGNTTGDLVKGGVVVTDHFGFSFHPITGQVGIGTSGNPYLGFLPGYFMHGLSSNEWDMRKAHSSNYLDSDAHTPINYIRVGEARPVADGGTSGFMLLGGLLGLGVTARLIRRRKTRSATNCGN